MVDDATPYTVSTQRRSTARRDYRCDECGRTIAAGERYERFSGLNSDWGKWETWRTCEHCLWARQWLSAQCGGWCFAGVAEDLRDHWDEDYLLRDLDLGRRIVGMRRKWKRHDGSLIPLAQLAA
jgi:hypothetical protein